MSMWLLMLLLYRLDCLSFEFRNLLILQKFTYFVFKFNFKYYGLCQSKTITPKAKKISVKPVASLEMTKNRKRKCDDLEDLNREVRFSLLIQFLSE